MAFKIVTRDAQGRVTFDASVKTVRSLETIVIPAQTSGSITREPLEGICYVSNNTAYAVPVLLSPEDTAPYRPSYFQSIAIKIKKS